MEKKFYNLLKSTQRTSVDGPWQLPLHNEEQQKDYVQAVESCPLVTLIHTADTLASKTIE